MDEHRGRFLLLFLKQLPNKEIDYILSKFTILINIILPNGQTIKLEKIDISTTIENVIKQELPDRDISRLSIFTDNNFENEIMSNLLIKNIIKNKQKELNLFVLNKPPIEVICYKNVNTHEIIISTTSKSKVVIVTVQAECNPWFVIEEFQLSDTSLSTVLKDTVKLSKFEIPIDNIYVVPSNSQNSIVWKNNLDNNISNLQLYFLLRKNGTKWCSGFWKYNEYNYNSGATNFIADLVDNHKLPCRVNDRIRKKFLVKNKKNNTKKSKWFFGTVYHYSNYTYTIKFDDGDKIDISKSNLENDIKKGLFEKITDD